MCSRKSLLKLKNLEVLSKNNFRDLIKNPVTGEEQHNCQHNERYTRSYHQYSNDKYLKGIRFYIESYCVKCRCLVSRLTL